MTTVKNKPRSGETRFKGEHILFVEGSDENAIDPKVLNILFDMQSIKIMPLGSSSSISSVAKALFRYHPKYYFLIDRDHHEESFVDQCWKNFPNAKTYNLLVWRRREIENYFLDPKYLFQSRFFIGKKADLNKEVLRCASNRLFLDVANYVVISIREKLKEKWIKKFSNPNQFENQESALEKIKSENKFYSHKENVNNTITEEEIERRFTEHLLFMTGGEKKLKLGVGEWLKMIQGKKVLTQVINSQCFEVKTTNGNKLSGSKKLHEIVKDLLKNDKNKKPDDFVKLKKLINARIMG